MAWGVVVAAGLVASSSASTRGRTAFLWEAPASRGCGFAGSVEVVGVAALDLDASYEPEWVLAAYARRLNAHPTCGVAVGGANVSVDLTVVDVKSRDFGAVRDPAATVVVSGAADAYWNRTGVVVAADPAATRSMLNASDAFFSVLRPADDRGWARRSRRSRPRSRRVVRVAAAASPPRSSRAPVRRVRRRRRARRRRGRRRRRAAGGRLRDLVGDVSFDGAGVATLPPVVSQYDAAGRLGLVDGAALVAPPWAERTCRHTHNCSGVGACQSDGTCACPDAADHVASKWDATCGVGWCPAGKEWDSKAQACAPCGPGTYRTNATAFGNPTRPCAVCDDYSWQSARGAAACEPCPAYAMRYPLNPAYTLDIAGTSDDRMVSVSAVLAYFASQATSPDECVCYKGACDAAEGDACHPPAGLPGGDWLDGAGTVEPAAATGAYGIWNGSRSAGGGPVCYACPAHGTCRGHYDLPRPARHYATVDYRGVDRRTLADSWKRIDYHACADFGGACESDFGCAPGQASRGLLCQRIATGETNIGDLAVRCRGSGGATTYVFQLALTLGMVVCFFFINYLSDQFSALGIFLTHGRSLAIISSVHVVWPRDPVLSFLFGALEATQFDVDVAPPRCVFATWGFRERLALQCGLALGMVAYYVTAKNTSVKLGVLALLMNYPSLCEVAFAALMCEGFEDGEAYLVQDLTLRCGSPKHVSVVVAAALILPVVVGIPAVVFFVLYKHIRRNTLNSARCLERWGPLYEGLRPEYAWWNAFVHILAIDLVRPHLHRSEALLERTLIATAVVIIAVAAVFAACGDDPSPAQDARKQALAVVLDVCLLACLSLTAFIVRQNVLQTAATARLVRCLSTLEAACHDAFDEGPSPVVRDGRHRTSSAAAAVKRALGGAERDARTYDFSPDDLIYVDAHVVAECCGDGHDVSTYSISPESSVWRTLTDAFPALFEWLANERSDDAVKQFGALVGRIVELRKRYRYGVAAVDAKWTFLGRAATRGAVVIEEAEKAEKAGRDADDLRRLSMERTRDANAGPVDDGKPAPFFFDEAISAFTHLACATRPSDPGAVFCDSPPPPYRNV
ncbi:hypothetical protein JL722_11108 [Aureococcus anophagefferens]|nr:hypothetical protein JL722_11108 [Aureococcus anophagefferens]